MIRVSNHFNEFGEHKQEHAKTLGESRSVAGLLECLREIKIKEREKTWGIAKCL